MKWTRRLAALLLCLVIVVAIPLRAVAENAENAAGDYFDFCPECGMAEGHAETCEYYGLDEEAANTPATMTVDMEAAQKIINTTVTVPSGTTIYDSNLESPTIASSTITGKVTNIKSYDNFVTYWYCITNDDMSIWVLSSDVEQVTDTPTTGGDDDDQGETGADDTTSTACTECGQTEGHLASCSQYTCPECNQTGSHAETCSKYQGCWCQNPHENLAEHADNCPRKIYIRNLVANETAESLYANWTTYDLDTQNDILNILAAYHSEVYNELQNLLNDQGEDDGFSTVYVTYEDTTNSGIGASILAPEGVFPEGTTVTVTDTTVYENQVSDLIDGAIRGIVAVDISFGVQPTGNVAVTMNIPSSQVPSGANMVYIVHIDDTGVAELVTSQYLNTASEGKSITFGTSSFSSYAAVFVSGKYHSQKLSDTLKGNTRYSIHTFDVQLFDYDPEQMNAAFRKLSSDAPFLFRGFGATDADTGTDGVNNSTAEYAKQGIVQDKLVNGLPVFNYVGGENGGTKTGEYLFGKTTIDGKTIYENAKFQFVYDDQTGYYQYKSSANHAQYNSSNNTIELYADTLSTQNQYVAKLDLTTYTTYKDDINGYESESVTDGVFKGTVKATKNSDNGTRFDPYVAFTVPSDTTTDVGLKASDIDKIYVKAKIPAGVGANALQVFFATSDTAQGEYLYSGNKSFIVPYTPTGDWIEFVIETEDCSYWPTDGTTRITQLRVDLFDTLQENGQTQLSDTTKTYEVEIAQISLIKDYDNYVTRGGFYPFSDIAVSYPGNGSNFTNNAWAKLMSDDTAVNALSSRSINNPTATATELKKDLYFGVAMELEFYIPVGKQVDGNDLTYYFNGDDDLWVFVDDQLVLDIGGGHGGITGSVNFTKGTTMVESAVKVDGYNSTKKSKVTSTVTDEETGQETTQEKEKVVAKKVEGTISDALTAPGKHTMKIFYMERCGSVSNCFMKFNLPQTPQGAVTVSKAVQDEDGNAIEALNETQFTFQISATNKSGTGNDTLSMADYDYKLFDSTTGATQATKTDKNGNFTLTATQTAAFDIPENYNVTVKETEPDKSNNQGYAWRSAKVNTTEALSAIQLTVAGEEKKFAFVNIYTPLYGNLKITKKGISDLDHNNAETQSTLYTIKGTSTTGETVDLTVAIVGNDSVTINHIPVGTYTVTENMNWAWRYDVTNRGRLVEVKGDATAETEFVNVRKNIYWLSGDCYCENYWTSEGVKKKEKS